MGLVLQRKWVIVSVWIITPQSSKSVGSRVTRVVSSDHRGGLVTQPTRAGASAQQTTFVRSFVRWYLRCPPTSFVVQRLSVSQPVARPHTHTHARAHSDNQRTSSSASARLSIAILLSTSRWRKLTLRFVTSFYCVLIFTSQLNSLNLYVLRLG